MDAREGLAERFEAQRGQLRAVAHRMLGSVDEADDAVQEAWLRLGRVDAGELDNLAALAADSGDSHLPRHAAFPQVTTGRPGRAASTGPCARPLSNANTTHGDGSTPEDEALLADSVSRALLVVLDTLAPAERIAFVLHDMFAVPFEEIAPVVGRTQGATKKLASRARLKVQGSPVVPAAELARHRRVVSAFLAAARAGDLTAILAVLAPDVVRRADPSALPPGGAAEVRGARAVAEGTAALAHRSRLAEPALVNGTVGAVVAPRGRLLFALTFTIESDRITEYEVIADPARLRRLDLAVLDRPGT